MITCLRAVIGFAWTFFVGTWVEARGAAEPFGIFCMLMGIFGRGFGSPQRNGFLIKWSDLQSGL